MIAEREPGCAASMMLTARELSATEQVELARLETQVRNSLTTASRHSDEYYRAKQAARVGLEELKRSRLWESTHPAAWDGYCLTTFGLSKRQVDRIIAAAAVVRDLEDSQAEDAAAGVGPIGPVNITDGAARELIGESKETRAAVWREIRAGGWKPTAQRVREVTDKLKAGLAAELNEIDLAVCEFEDARRVASNDRHARLANRTAAERHEDAMAWFHLTVGRGVARLPELPRDRRSAVQRLLTVLDHVTDAELPPETLERCEAVLEELTEALDEAASPS